MLAVGLRAASPTALGKDGAKILILWIENLHLQGVPKFVDRREPVDLEYK